MATFTGISSLADLNIQTLKGSAKTYGLQKINAEIQKDLANYNSQVSEMMASFCENLTEQVRVFNTTNQITMNEVDEFGKSRTKSDSGRWDVSFPVRKFIAGVGYSLEWLNRATVQEISDKFTALQLAHQKNIVKQTKQAIYTSGSSSFVDEHFNGETLTLRSFWCNDGATIPVNSAGSSFTAHTHYIGSSSGSVAATDVSALVLKVTEHDQTDDLMLVIHPNNYDAIAALTGFTALSSSVLSYDGTTSTVVKIDNSNLTNRMVGYWKNSIEIWVKPWAVENFMVCLATGSPDGKPLGFRQLPWNDLQGLKLNSLYENEPLVAQEGIAYEGMSVLNRSAGAVLQLNSSSYTNPTIS
jgi:hypothetical protein